MSNISEPIVAMGPHRPGTQRALDELRAGEASFGWPGTYRGQSHIIAFGSCTWRGLSQWGYMLACRTCGAVEAALVSSSVACEDAPGRFSWAHRDCAPSADVAPSTDPYGRIMMPSER